MVAFALLCNNILAMVCHCVMFMPGLYRDGGLFCVIGEDKTNLEVLRNNIIYLHKAVNSNV